MNTSSTSPKKGFTLIEVMIATFLVGILGAGVISGATVARRLTYVNAQRVSAFGLAKAKLEELKGRGYNELDALYGSQVQEVDLDLVNLGGVTQEVIPATRTLSLQDLTSPQRKRVTVRIQWEFQGREIDETVQTFLYPRR
jgi:prepilin-type N-terminal cleavage/methylation domain-containing protein